MTAWRSCEFLSIARRSVAGAKITPPQGGLPQISYIICDQVRTISNERLGKRFGTVSQPVLTEVERRLKFMLDLH